MIKKIDCFKFFNEIELLHLRFLEYYEYVDYFVIVEATKSHTGKPKPLIFNENKDKFSNYMDKVVHIIVEDLPNYSIDNIWEAENFQRNCIERGLQKIANVGDKIFISDCDEFWDTDTATQHLSNNNLVTFRQDLYYYYVNCKQNQVWNGSAMYTYGSRFTQQQIRNMARGDVNSIYPGGWHYSFMGGAERIKEKVENIAESHLIIDKIGTIDEINNKMENATDLWNRTDHDSQKQFINLSYTPKSLNKFIELYPNFFKGNI